MSLTWKNKNFVGYECFGRIMINGRMACVTDRIADPTRDLPQRVGMRSWLWAAARTALGRRRAGGRA
jgi:hypothetical protein